MKNFSQRVLTVNVVVGALGYFVDIYDLLLFSIVRVPSLKSLGVPASELLEKGVFLINSQMTGLLIGGFLWGVLGDKRGRLSVLFGSILLYSIANIANAYVTSVEMYGVLRFIAGVGLAGELGAAITLVSETLSREKRGYGTSIVAGVGILGAVFAALVGDRFSWQTAYLVGGGLGITLLALRVTMYESSLFKTSKSDSIRKGDLRLLFFSKARAARYLHCILIGVPIWFVVGILMTFSLELSQNLGVIGEVSPGYAIGFCYVGLSLGDITCGFLSQWIKSRKRAIAVFLTLTFVAVLTYLFSRRLSLELFYALCALLGFGAGYWAVFITVAAEQFGTNLRATVTTTAPNMVRGAVVLLTLGFKSLTVSIGLINSALAVGLICLSLAFHSLYRLRETYGRDLDFYEVTE